MPRDGTATRERILDAAQRLVIDRGFSATSVDAVLGAAATSKGAFFNHFPTKDAMAKALVERYVQSDLSFLTEGLAVANAIDGTAQDRAIGFLQFYEDAADELVADTVGCLYTSVLADLDLVTPGTQGTIEDALSTWRREYAVLLQAALPPTADIDVDDLADHVFVTFEGGYLLARATSDPSQLRRQLRVLRMAVAALLARAGD